MARVTLPGSPAGHVGKERLVGIFYSRLPPPRRVLASAREAGRPRASGPPLFWGLGTLAAGPWRNIRANSNTTEHTVPIAGGVTDEAHFKMLDI